MIRSMLGWLLIALLLPVAAVAEPIPQPDYAKAEVQAAETVELGRLGDSPLREVSQQLTLKIISGKFKGRLVQVEHMAAGSVWGEMVLKKGDRVVLYVDEHPTQAESPDGRPLFHVADYARDVPIYWLTFLFVLALVAVGGWRGARALIGLVITIALVFLVLFPLLLRGVSPLPAAILVCGLVCLAVFPLIGGRSVKSLAAAVGTLLGVSAAGLLAWIAGNSIHLTGMSSEESRMLLYSMNITINYQGLVFAGILIGALGAIMDVGMSIASAVAEIRKIHPEVNFLNLFRAGMNVGRDIMGTMSNTLILAYTGSALPLLLLLQANQLSAAKIVNMEMIAEEAVRALAGSIGLVLCVPLTALVSALLYVRKRRP